MIRSKLLLKYVNIENYVKPNNGIEYGCRQRDTTKKEDFTEKRRISLERVDDSE